MNPTVQDEEKRLETLKEEFLKLEEQRKEATVDYAKTIFALKETINDLEAKVNNLNGILNTAFATRLKEINESEKSIQDKKDEADRIKTEADNILKGVQIKQEEVANDVILLEKQKCEHLDNVENHINASQNELHDIANRKCVISLKEQNILNKISDVDSRMEVVVKRENELEERLINLTHMSRNIDEDIKLQKDLQSKNKLILIEIDVQRNDLVCKQNKIDFDKQELVRIGTINQSIEDELNKKKEEISNSLYDLKNANVKNDIVLQKISNKEKDVQCQIGKLNDLKNNLNILMKKQEESKGA